MGEAAGNGTKAAVLAGYAPATARHQASRLLTKAHIRSAIEERRQSDSLTWSREQRQAFWSRIAGDESVAVRDRLKASELLARASGDFLEKRLVQIDGNGPLTLAEMIVGTGPRSLRPALVPEAPVTPIAHTPDSAVTGPTPPARVMTARSAGAAVSAAVTAREPPVVSPGGDRQGRWGVQSTPAVEGPGTSNTDYDPFS